jgi:DNA replication protein DnaC
MFVTAARLARWSRYDEAAMEKLLKAKRLVIDDIGTEFMDANGSYQALLDEIVNERYANKRPTLMTTNLEVQAFAARYGERVADRIRESGRFVFVGRDSLRGKP